MKSSTKISNDYKFGMNGAKKKLGINCWRFVFNAINTVTGSEQMFYIAFLYPLCLKYTEKPVQ